jgi:hypothetical protein
MIKWFKKRFPSWREMFCLHDALLTVIVRYYVPKEVRPEVREMIQEATGTNWNHDDDFLVYSAGVYIDDKIRRNKVKQS